MAEILTGTLLVMGPADALVLVRLVERERQQRRVDGVPLRQPEVELFAKIETATGQGDGLRWVRAAEAARLLKIKPQSLHDRIAAGSLPSRREGRAVYVGLSGRVRAS